MRQLVSTCAVGTLLILPQGCCRPGSSGMHGVSLRPQESEQWCWAASGQMVMEAVHHGTNQCTQVNGRLGRSDCPCNQCSTGTLDFTCDQTGWPEFEKYGFTARRTNDAPLSWSQIKEQVSAERSCKNRPFAFSWRWEGGGGHMMVARGYREVDGERYVAVLDPYAPCSGDELLIAYDFYVAAPGDHTHWNDYYDVEYRGR